MSPLRACVAGLSGLLPIASIGVMASVGACGANHDGQADPATPTTAAAAVSFGKFELVDPTPTRVRAHIVATGNLKALASAQLAMPAPGTLARVFCRRGEAVAEGALMATLDDAAARAAVAQADAAVAAARAQLALAEDALGRVKRLRAEEGVSESQLIQSQAQRDLASAQLAAAQAQRDQAQVNLRYQTLRAPFAGVVIRSPDGFGFAVSPAVPLFGLESMQTLILETSVTQEEAPALAVGMPALVTVPATGARSDKASIRVIVPSVDPASNRVPIEITVPNPDQRFLAHAFARVELSGREEQAAWGVPGEALTQSEGAFSVWVATADRRARTIRVRVFDERREQAVVDPGAAGWPEGAKIIAKPPLGICEGMQLAGGKAP